MWDWSQIPRQNRTALLQWVLAWEVNVSLTVKSDQALYSLKHQCWLQTRILQAWENVSLLSLSLWQGCACKYGLPDYLQSTMGWRMNLCIHAFPSTLKLVTHIVASNSPDNAAGITLSQLSWKQRKVFVFQDAVQLQFRRFTPIGLFFFFFFSQEHMLFDCIFSLKKNRLLVRCFVCKIT